MKKLSIGLFFVLIVIGCSSKSQVVLKDTDYLKYGTRASVIEQAWGKPDETMAFQDYQAQSKYSFWHASGSWDRYGGYASGGGFSGTYTPTTIVWIYREKGIMQENLLCLIASILYRRGGRNEIIIG